MGTVVSLNVGSVRAVEWDGHTITTAIWKGPVPDRREVGLINVVGDDQADRAAHGGPDKAVYAYSLADHERWAAELGIEVTPGLFGENVTTAGLDLTGALIGERWRVGNALLEVAQPRIPCYKLGIRFGDPLFPRRFAAAGRPGAYLRVIEPGDIGAGDTIEVLNRPEHGLTVGDVASIYHVDRASAARLLPVAALAESWRRWAAHRLAEAERRPRS